jgi:hypothetical protein
MSFATVSNYGYAQQAPGLAGEASSPSRAAGRMPSAQTVVYQKPQVFVDADAPRNANNDNSPKDETYCECTQRRKAHPNGDLMFDWVACWNKPHRDSQT